MRSFLHKLAQFIFPTLTITWMAYHVFVVTKFPFYPWWHRMGGDIDSSFVTGTISLINDGRMGGLASQPSMTLFSLHGLVYRMLAHFNTAYSGLLRLHHITHIEEAVALIAQGTLVSRHLTFLFLTAFLILIYALFYKISRKHWLTFLLTFFLVTSKGVAYYLHVIRIEPYSMFFFALAGYFSLPFFLNDRSKVGHYLKNLVPVGICLGLAVFAKMLIGPPIVAVLLLGCVFLVYRTPEPSDVRGGSVIWTKVHYGIEMALVNVIIFPWWACFRPDFMTVDFLQNRIAAHPGWTHFGPAEANMTTLPLYCLTGFLVISAYLYFYVKRRKCSGWGVRMLPAVCFLNTIVFGMIVAAYLVCIPASASFQGYLINIQHMMYAVLTNIVYKGFVLEGVTLDRFAEVVHRFQGASIVGINLLVFLMVMTAGSVWRLCRKGTQRKWLYVQTLFWFLLAVGMDILAMKRSRPIAMYYALYPICFGVTGILFWFKAEIYTWAELWKNWRESKNIRSLAAVCSGTALMCVLLLGAHFFYQWIWLVHQPRADGVSRQSSLKEYFYNVRVEAPFWHAVNKGLQKNADMHFYKQQGQTLAFGVDLKKAGEIIAQVHHQQSDIIESPGNIKAMNAWYMKDQKINTYTYFALITLARVMQERGKVRESLDVLTQAVKIYPNFIEAHWERGKVYMKSHDVKRALNDFNQVLRLQQDQYAVYEDRARAYLLDGKRRSAEKDIQTALNNNIPVDSKLIAELENR